VDARPISDIEAGALEGEELLLVTELERWRAFFTSTPESPEIDVVFVNPDGVETGETEDEHAGPEAGNVVVTVHGLIAANLKRIQSDLAKLLTRWTSAAPEESALNEEADENE
jgi:hypothetical protein